MTALHLAGLFKDSDGVVDQFVQTYPKSTLMPAVLFRQAENAYLAALAAADGKEPRPRDEQEKLFGAAIDRYKKFAAKYPEFDYTDLARQGLGICYARTGKYAEAIAALQTIPESNRTGELATVPYLLADCEIRTLPAETDDALTAELLIQAAEDAAKYLDAFVSSQPKSPQTPDAMLKLGYCYQRVAAQIAAAEERKKILTQAAEVYDKAIDQFRNDPAIPSLIFERAKVAADLGDAGRAQNDLARFQKEPLNKTPNAPLAMVRLSALFRANGQPQQALDVMKRCRDDYESTLANDPSRQGWIPLMRYEQAMAFQELHKPAEAQTIFEELAKQFPGKPAAANANWRLAQIRRVNASEKLAERETSPPGPASIRARLPPLMPLLMSR